jgi:hypothetical protein
MEAQVVILARLSNSHVILAAPAGIRPSAISHRPLAFSFKLAAFSLQFSVFNSAFRAPQPRAAPPTLPALTTFARANV